jgi:signal transduction histidine kinase
VCELSNEALWITGDTELLSQVFVNLFLNALEAMPAGGQLSVVATTSDAPQYVRVTVTDTGTGFHAEVLNRLFEPFVTTRERGTGLGLPICRRIVLEHNGQIRATNRAEGGAVVVVDLPSQDGSISWKNS